MKAVTEFEHAVCEWRHVDIPMPDGVRLAARIWTPQGAEHAPVPAVLEYIPYRKNDLCAPEDRMNGQYLAGHGYAYIRLDLRGAGDSEGLLLDEYLAQELQDGVDAIAWIAAQPWCDGNVGMIGISWGGFNGLQIAALRPPALKAIITVCSTDDRYADDVHYMGGCLLLDNLSWASQMFARNSLPPDPHSRGESWRALWLDRLRHSGLWLKNWLEHQTRDEFWRHGSVAEDYTRIEVPVYAVSGWADGYCRSVFRLMENLSGPRKGLIGPWAHKYPHLGKPGPAVGFMQETLRWWDQWLKGRETGIMDEPMLRLFMQDSAPPQGGYAVRAGRWVAEPSWPSSSVTRTAFGLATGGRLTLAAGTEPAGPPLAVRSPLMGGKAAGKWCSYAVPGDQPVDQRIDDGGALVFETDPLIEPFEIAGDAALDLSLAVDRPVAQVAVRLGDVAPDGAVTRVTYGVFNLTHRNGHETPEPLVPGRTYRVRVPMKPVAQRFAPGHRLRLAISTNYFPLIWPSPEPVTLTVFPHDSALDLPVRTTSPADAELPAFDPPESAPRPAIEQIEESGGGWQLTHDLGTDACTLDVRDGSGQYRLVDEGITVTKTARERYVADPADPQGVSGRAEWTMGLAHDGWSITTHTQTTLTSTPTAFRVQATLRAWEGETLVHEQEWDETIARVLV
ncbi:CocE/NonD family hydrolase [Fodinicurvata sp. EGI_FJ10296]|uniref:CocE/NonD family hydrolase n=1 Tax=Fodinicurvata sp. EGI_FJ10296 TaxID=3231908 RepID=UPI0034536FE0